MPAEGPVGRQAELARVDAFLAAAGEGLRALVVAGPAGIGKTTVWHEAVCLAREQGCRVLGARASGAEARLSFAGLTDLLADVDAEALDGLPEPQRHALDVALLRAPSQRAPEQRLIGTALLSLIQALASAGEIVIAVDDLHWLDPPSAAALEFALRRAVDEPVRAIFSLRSGEAEPAVLAVLEREGRLERLELGPMSVAALHRVLARELGRSFSRPTLVRIATAAQGNPLYAIEIARLVDRSDGLRGSIDLPVPESLGSLVAARVRALPARTRDELLRTATLARPDLRLVDAEALEPAEEAGLVRIRPDRRVEFAHPLFASAVYATASTGRRRRTHLALAPLVDDPEERARHLALSCDGPDEGVVEELEAAARRARMRGAPDTAAEFAELALRLVPEDSPSVGELRLRLAEHLYLASDFQRAVAELEQLSATLTSGDLRARALLTLAEIVYWRSGESAAVELSEQALADARDPLVAARCQVSVAMHAGTVDLAKAAAAARAALVVLESRADADPGVVAAALAARVRAELFLGEGYDAGTAERALSLEQAAPPAAVDTRMVFKLGQWLRYVDDFDGARVRLAQAEEQAREEGDDSSLANILLNRVVLETWSGELAEATELAERMVDAFAQQGVSTEGAIVWRVLVDAFAGRVDAVREAAAGADPAEPIVEALWDRTVGLAELAAGETEVANRRLSRALEQFDRIDFREPAIWRVDGDAIEAALGVGDRGRAETLAVRFEERAQRSGIPWSLAVSARCRGLLHAADGELDLAVAALERALEAHENCPMPFERGRTLLALGQLLRRRKERRAARKVLEQALAIFDDLAVSVWAERVRGELARIPVRRAAGDLTPTEEAIAGLAASGLTNRVIAERVFVSPKTVESNLARVYRKLGIRSRAELGRAMAERERLVET
jgi:DNA-binding CsgD family transcriptional regulator